MKALLLVGHGTRDDVGNDEFVALTERVTARLDTRDGELRVSRCFLELRAPLIKAAAQVQLDAGCRAIYLSVYVLFAAGHLKHDIPGALHTLAARYGDVSFYIGPPAGNAEELLQAAALRVQDVLFYHPAYVDAPVLFVVRGSSDQAAWEDVRRASRALSDRLSRPVLPCSIVGVGPRLKDVLRSTRNAAILLPYLLFTGFVLREIQAVCLDAKREGRLLVCADPLGRHPLVEDFFYHQANQRANFMKYAIE
ncbi:sirohydrochlorin chelatase [Ferroacidibacillus organovorans]|uniref:Cobalamin biosynthesis protein CbiX n=1 Tax=Ferroacidibacillus organovorans TaxID=1765683 RepID=A0A117SYK9_9BACL|nr:sirohydrochlorin chelatase [Ferroacidibacillus organovorans]KUO97115.1 hypothetical protein ATW55_12455 [Ferroacidibacillus organovorans]